MISIKNQFLYRIQNETEQELYLKFNTCKQNVLRNNPNIPIYEGELVYIKTNDYITHHVKPAETLLSIAQRYNITEQQIIADNNLTTNKLFIGQSLKIYKK